MESKMGNDLIHILIVDESSRTSNELKPYLEAKGYTVTQIKSRSELITHFNEGQQYHVVLISPDLPQEPGGKRYGADFEFVEDVREKFPSAEVRLFTNDSDAMLQNRYGGVIETISSVSPIAKLDSRIERAIRISKSRAERIKILNTIHGVTTYISQLTNLDDIYRAVSKACVNLFDEVDHSGVVLFNSTSKYGRVVAEYPDNSFENETIQLEGIPIEEEILSGVRYVKSINIRVDEERFGAVGNVLEERGIKSILIVPLRHNGELLGSFSLDSIQHRHDFTADEIELAQIFAAHVAASIAYAQQLLQRNLFNEIALAMSKVTERDRLLGLIVEEAVKFFRGRSGGIAVWNERRDGFEVVGDRWRTRGEDTLQGIGEGLYGYLVKSGKSFEFTPNYAQEPYKYPFLENGLDKQAMIAVRLDWDGTVLGVLYIEDVLGRIFDESEAKQLQVFADHAASALHTANLLEQANRDAQRLERLFEISSEYSGKVVTAKESIRRVIEIAREETGADGVAFVNIDTSRKVTSVTAVGIYEDRFTAAWVRDSGNSQDVFASKQPITIPNVSMTQDQYDLNDSIFACGLNALVCLPALVGNRCIGVFWIVYFEPRNFSGNEIKAWQLFFNQVATIYQLNNDKEKLNAEQRLSQGAIEMVALDDSDNEGVLERIVDETQQILGTAYIGLYVYDDKNDIVTKGVHRDREQIAKYKLIT